MTKMVSLLSREVSSLITLKPLLIIKERHYILLEAVDPP